MELITELKENQIFVFGSNENGNHAGGAARQAVESFGAIMGQAKGLQGQSYAIVTLDKDMKKVSLGYIKEQLETLNEHAKQNSDKEYLMTLIGCGIAGFEIEDIRDICMTIAWSNNVIIPEEFSVIHSYKGFKEDMTCREFQYKEGETYKTDRAKKCEYGFHACEHPLDVFSFYSPNTSVFHAVEQRGIISKDETKTASTEITIKGKLSIADMVKAAIDFTFNRTKKDGASSATGYKGASSATGYKGASSATGLNSIALAAGYQCRAIGEIGSWLCIAERDEWNGETYPIKTVLAVKVDGKKVKPNVWYMVKNGKLKEWQDED